MTLDAVLHRIDETLPQSLDRLMTLLRIPSISTDPAHRGDVRAAAEWLCAELAGLGFDASVRDTPGHPMVVAHSQKGDRRPVLFYGHYDVQPVDPPDHLVERPEPELRHQLAHLLRDELEEGGDELGRAREALDHLRQAYALQADPDIASHLAQVLWTLGRKEEARHYFDEARRLDPDNRSLQRALRETGA